ncbi:hypothetical protein [Halalkalibacter alkalisediminis]|uniref:Uncharacterized protein n=1 Tax=Halalkalibacter alkalisediminis TaxID=935616 RepID=A0ABV6NAW5_9BACI|nr:hypothetical protein [Halalkalibacter alkalisediminis]
MSKQKEPMTYFNGKGLKNLKPLNKRTNPEWLNKPQHLRACVKYPIFPYST